MHRLCDSYSSMKNAASGFQKLSPLAELLAQEIQLILVPVVYEIKTPKTLIDPNLHLMTDRVPQMARLHRVLINQVRTFEMMFFKLSGSECMISSNSANFR